MTDQHNQRPAEFDDTPSTSRTPGGYRPTPPDDEDELEEGPIYHNAPNPVSGYSGRLERLGGEPAPVITPEEFARLQRAGQVHIDERGRVRATRRSDAEGGVSLRKRRAWYGCG
jgi:hypothetical protein